MVISSVATRLGVLRAQGVIKIGSGVILPKNKWAKTADNRQQFAYDKHTETGCVARNQPAPASPAIKDGINAPHNASSRPISSGVLSAMLCLTISSGCVVPTAHKKDRRRRLATMKYDRDQQGCALDNRIVPRQNGIIYPLANSWPGEDRFGSDCPCKQGARLNADDRDDRQKCILERMP